MSATVLGTVLGTVATAGVASLLRWPLLALLAVNVLYMAVTGMPAVIGVVLHLCGRRMRPAAMPSGLSRTALVMPVCNEDPALVFAEVGTMARALAEARVAVDLFVLSDTRDPVAGAAELAAFEALRAVLPPRPGLHYRRRADNAGRKVGNLAEFCERWGGQLRLHGGAGRGQPDGRLGRGAADRVDGCEPAGRDYPDRTVSGWTAYAVRAAAAVRGAVVHAVAGGGADVLAGRRWQLLGAQCNRPPRAVSVRIARCRSCRGGSRSGGRSCATTWWRPG